MSAANHHLHEMRPPCIGKCPEIKIKKDIKEIKQYTHTPSLFSGFVDWRSW